MCLTTGVINFKGGVGKTTTTINMAAGLTKLKQKVLVIDTDAQGNVTNSIGLQYEDDDKVITTASLMQNPRIDPLSAVREGKYFDFIPNNVFAYTRTNGISDSQILTRIVERLKPYYNHIIIDTPPYLGLDTANAIAASDVMMIVTDFSKGSLTGIKVLMTVLDAWHDKRIADSFKSKPKTILFTKYQSRTIISQQVLTKVENSSDMGLMQERIPQTVKIVEDGYAGVPSVINSPRTTVAREYMSLCQTWITAETTKVLKGKKAIIKLGR
jgi:chromosome partitioning protein